MGLRGRIQRLEGRLRADDFCFIEIHGGPTPGLNDRHGSVSGASFERGADESLEVFRERLRSEAVSRGCRFASIGGFRRAISRGRATPTGQLGRSRTMEDMYVSIKPES